MRSLFMTVLVILFSQGSLSADMNWAFLGKFIPSADQIEDAHNNRKGYRFPNISAGEKTYFPGLMQVPNASPFKLERVFVSAEDGRLGLVYEGKSGTLSYMLGSMPADNRRDYDKFLPLPSEIKLALEKRAHIVKNRILYVSDILRMAIGQAASFGITYQDRRYSDLDEDAFMNKELKPLNQNELSKIQQIAIAAIEQDISLSTSYAPKYGIDGDHLTYEINLGGVLEILIKKPD